MDFNTIYLQSIKTYNTMINCSSESILNEIMPENTLENTTDGQIYYF